VCILRDAEVGLCVKRVVSYDNLDSIKISRIEKMQKDHCHCLSIGMKINQPNLLRQTCSGLRKTTSIGKRLLIAA
jgi:hypothetical protein